MQKKYITLIDQLIQGYHLEKDELEDLEEYLKSHLRSIELRKEKVFTPKQLDCWCCWIPFNTWEWYKNQWQDSWYWICRECQ